MRWIYLSPHLDDAVFSAGGLIYDQTQAGTPVEIWTFMCGDPRLTEYSQFTQALHQVWGFSSAEETVRKRRAEDSLAASIVGAKAVHLDFLDCIYRRDTNGDWLYPSEIFGAIHPADADYPAHIWNGSTRKVIGGSSFFESKFTGSWGYFDLDPVTPVPARLNPDDVLVCQLGLGSHVDHVLVRRGAELLGRPLRYDVDVPYVLAKPEEFAPKAVGMVEKTVRITEASLPRWVEASVAYQSQLPALGDQFDTPEQVSASLRKYWSERQGIRLLQLD
ncbi:MAG TPA: PIG-L family deacetylase [Anaerolineales bacterium]|nr:PIG-L family deacetylase [Anaerolineales bacterium]